MTTIKYPLTAVNGDLVLSNRSRAGIEAILSAVSTKHGERVLRNNYGQGLEELTTIGDIAAIITQITEDIYDSTRDYVPLSVVVDGRIDDDGQLVATIYYNDETITTKI